MSCKFKRNFGIEIEFLSPLDRETVAVSLAETLGRGFYIEEAPYFNEFRKHYILPSEVGKWELVTDKSVKGLDGYQGFEIVSPVLTDSFLLEKVVACLNSQGMRVNGTAGIHVHWDLPSLSELKSILDVTFGFQNQILDNFKVPSYRRTGYCKVYSSETIDKYNAIKDDFTSVEELAEWFVLVLNKEYNVECSDMLSPRNPARYFLFNVHSILLHHTIEFRWFNSVLDIGTIVSYLYFLEMLYLGGK